MESRKTALMKLFAWQQWRRREQTMDTRLGREGEGWMHGESNTKIYITMCKIDSQWEFAV